MLYKICLHCIAGKEKGKKWKFAVGENTIVIGRLRGCHLVLSDDQISQSHCLVQMQQEELCIIDMGSTKGTYVNDKKIEGKYALKNNETIQLGTTFLKLEIISPDSTKIYRSQIGTRKIEKAQYIEHISNKEEVEKAFIQNSNKQEKNMTEDDLLVKEFLAHNHPQNSGDNEKEKRDSDSTNINIQKCILCEQQSDHLDFIDHQSKWLCCSLCKELGNALQKWENYQIIGKPLWIDDTGLFFITIDRRKQKKEYMYVYRNKSSVLETINTDNQYDDITLLALRQETINHYPCIFYRFIHGNFWDIHSFLTPMQILKFALGIAEKIAIYSRYKTYNDIVPQKFFITATNKLLLFDSFSASRNHSDKSLYYQAPEILCGQKELDHQASIFSFAAIIFASVYKQKVYEAQNIDLLKKEANDLCWSKVEKKINTHPIINKFFAKTICEKSHRYKKWSDVIDSLNILILMI